VDAQYRRHLDGESVLVQPETTIVLGDWVKRGHQAIVAHARHEVAEPDRYAERGGSDGQNDKRESAEGEHDGGGVGEKRHQAEDMGSRR
jgi:hypothetical protein